MWVKFRRASTLPNFATVVRSFSPPQHTGWSAGPSPWGCCSLVLSIKIVEYYRETQTTRWDCALGIVIGIRCGVGRRGRREWVYCIVNRQHNSAVVVALAACGRLSTNCTRGEVPRTDAGPAAALIVQYLLLARSCPIIVSGLALSCDV